MSVGQRTMHVGTEYNGRILAIGFSNGVRADIILFNAAVSSVLYVYYILYR